MSIAERRGYYEHRRSECLKQAAAAADPSIAELHRQFAAHYEKSARDLDIPPPSLRAREAR